MKVSKSLFENYTVYVESGCATGSGILFKPNSKSMYAILISAKHVFTRDNQNGIFPDENIAIKLSCHNSSEEIKLINDSIYLLSEPLDVAIGIIDLNGKSYANKVFHLQLFNDEIEKKSEEIKVIGYSAVRKKIKTANPETDIFTVKDIYTCQDDEELVVSNIPDGTISGNDRNGYNISTIVENSKGMSGGGVFVKRGEDVYLYGVLKEVRHGAIFKHHKISDDRILAELNSIKDKYDQLQGIDNNQFTLSSCFFGKNTILDFHEIMSSKNINDLENKIGTNRYIEKISPISEDAEFLRAIQDENKNSEYVSANQLKKDLIKNRLEVANYFSFIGLRFFKKNDFYRSSYYINQAAKIDPDYNLFVLKTKIEKNNGKKKLEITSELDNILLETTEYSHSDKDKLSKVEAILELDGYQSLDKVFSALQLIKKIQLAHCSDENLNVRKSKLLDSVKDKLEKDRNEIKITDEGFYIQWAEILEDYGDESHIKEIVKSYRMALNFIKLKNDLSQNELKIKILTLLSGDVYKSISLETEVEKDFDNILSERGGKERYLQQEMVKSIQSSIEGTSEEIRRIVESALKSNEVNVSQQNTYYSNIDEKITSQFQQYKEVTNKVESIFLEINNRISSLEVDPIRKTELLNSLVSVKSDILNEFSSNSDKNSALMKHVYDSTLEKNGALSDLVSDFGTQTRSGITSIATHLTSKESTIEKQMEFLKGISDKLSFLENQASLKKVSVTFNVKAVAFYLSLISLSSLLTYLAIQLI